MLFWQCCIFLVSITLFQCRLCLLIINITDSLEIQNRSYIVLEVILTDWASENVARLKQVVVEVLNVLNLYLLIRFLNRKQVRRV